MDFKGIWPKEKEVVQSLKVSLLIVLILSPGTLGRPPVKSIQSDDNVIEISQKEKRVGEKDLIVKGDAEQNPVQDADLKLPADHNDEVVKDGEFDEGAGDEMKSLHPVRAAAVAAAKALLPLKDLELPDHLDAVRLEQDGHLNKDYHKEILLGNHEEFEESNDEEKEEKLKEIFHKVDKDHDGHINQAELEEWILLKVQEHFDEANDETERIFKHLDSDTDGSVSWDEFHTHFLLAKGYPPEEVEKHVADYETIMMDPDAKETLIRYKFRWAEADEEPQDNKLSWQEFASFRHPEQSKAMMDRMVAEIIESLDQDDDGIISREEFVMLPPEESEYAMQNAEKEWQEERMKEFNDVIDLDGDGKLTKEELLVYVDPKNPNHSRLEAENLIQLADENKDGLLSLQEVLDNDDLFYGSKMVETGRNFHDEF